MRVLDLFSGIGGFSLGLRMAGGFETVQFVEIEPYCQKVLAKNFPGVPIHADIRSFQPARGSADLICGGFPCQPFSVAGQRAGTADDRDLWPEMARVIQAVRPAWVIGENVAGFVTMELDRSLSDLEALGYACQALVIPACAVDARHRRDRVWVVGYADRNSQSVGAVDAEATGNAAVGHAGGDGRQATLLQFGDGAGQSRVWETGQSRSDGAPIPDTNGSGREQQRRGQSVRAEQSAAECGGQWEPEPAVGRVANGIPRRVDRLRGLGNAVVPQVVAEIGKAIMSAALDAINGEQP